MNTLIIILWFVFGMVAVWRIYFGLLKSWHKRFDHDLREYTYGFNSLRFLIIFSPVIIGGGLFSLFISEFLGGSTWYYFIPKTKKNIKN